MSDEFMDVYEWRVYGVIRLGIWFGVFIGKENLPPSVFFVHKISGI